jgi:hypothetical protein
MKDVENGAAGTAESPVARQGKLEGGAAGGDGDGAAWPTAVPPAAGALPPPADADVVARALGKVSRRIVPLTWAVALMNHLDRSK